MGINERLRHPGMPPLSYVELDSRVIEHSEDPKIQTIYYWVEGELPHLGKVINGYKGKETFVEIYINDTYMRMRRDFYDLAPDHPLFETVQQEKPVQIYPYPKLQKSAA